MEFQSRPPRSYKNYQESEQELQIKQKALEEANKQCQIGKTWMSWNDLYAVTYGQNGHGSFAQVFRTYDGISNCNGLTCNKCPKIMAEAWENLKKYETFR